MLRVLPPAEVRRALRPELRSLGYREWQQRYQHDLVGFVRDCVILPRGERLAPYQIEASELVQENDRVSLRGPRGLGKTTWLAWCLHWWALVWDGVVDWKVITTASVWRQLSLFLWPEVHKWAHLLRWDYIGRPAYDERHELLLTKLQLSSGQAAAVASNDEETMEGAHATALLYLFDEAKIISLKAWDAVEGAFSNARGKWVACSTPGVPSGRFYDIHRHAAGTGDWRTLRVTLHDAVEAGRVAASWVEARKTQWGEDNPLYKQQVMGDFAEDVGQVLVPLSWIEGSNVLWDEWERAGRYCVAPAHPQAVREGKRARSVVSSLGFDVGEGFEGSDRSTVAIIMDGHIIERVWALPRPSDPDQSLMMLAGQIAEVIEAKRAPVGYGDIIGIGAGVVHRLRELGRPVHPWHAGWGTTLKDTAGYCGFANWRAAGWYIVRSMLDPTAPVRLLLPADEDLTAELTTPLMMTLNSRQELVLEPKDLIRRRLGRSPDLAEAVVHGLTGRVLSSAKTAREETRIERHAPAYHIGRY